LTSDNVDKHCSTQPYVCVDKEGQSRTQLNVLHADAVPWNSPSDDQLAYIIFKAIFKVLIGTLHTYLGQVCMGPLGMR
jgi:hypothetical protein